jgi:hypothetical protein
MFALFFSLVVSAQELRPPLIQGDYQASGAFKVLTHKKWEDVFTETVEGQKHLQELIDQGYNCRAQGEVYYSCALSVASPKPSPELSQVVEKRWKNALFSFYRWIGNPKLVNNTDFYKEWAVPQKAVQWEIAHQKEKAVWNPISYTWAKGNEWKMYLGTLGNDLYVRFLIADDRNLQISDYVEFSKGLQSESYYIILPVEKVQP